MFEKHNRYIRFITLMVPLFLVFMGMRVPDFSRPHKPKPMRRAVLDKAQAQTVQESIVKINVTPFLASQHTFVLIAAEEYIPEVQPTHLPVPLLSRSPFPPRAPPVLPSLA
jgi:hypothetical protein